MPKSKENEIKLPSLDELFSTQEERDDAKLARIYEIPIAEIDPFPDHPFKVKDDEDMENLVESMAHNLGWLHTRIQNDKLDEHLYPLKEAA